jgi:hypothetical protein
VYTIPAAAIFGLLDRVRVVLPHVNHTLWVGNAFVVGVLFDVLELPIITTTSRITRTTTTISMIVTVAVTPDDPPPPPQKTQAGLWGRGRKVVVVGVGFKPI